MPAKTVILSGHSDEDQKRSDLSLPPDSQEKIELTPSGEQAAIQVQLDDLEARLKKLEAFAAEFERRYGRV